MRKKAMEDMKPKGVRITEITRESRNSSVNRPELKAPSEQVEKEIKIVKEEASQIPINTSVRDNRERISSTPRVARRSGGTRKSFRNAFVVTLIFGAFYWASYLLQNANITIVEKHQPFTLDHKEFTASVDPKSQLEFQIMIVSNEQSKDVTLTDSQDVSIKAQGEMTLYNEYSTKVQNLLIHTMIADPNGKTYETDKAVAIPGYKLGTDKKIIPGTIDVGITAFLAGDAYNGAPATFSINGFKGTDKGKKIYGKLKTPLTGGAQGVVYTLGPEDKGSVNATAVSSFKSSLIKKVNAEVPVGYILYPNAIQFSYETNDNILSPTPQGKIVTSGTMASVILKEDDLVHSVVKNLLPDISGTEINEVALPDLASLTFNFVNPDQVITKDMQSVSFTLTGPLTAIWHPDIDKLRATIIGIAKKDLPSIFKQDPGIAEATARIFPPWQKRLPTDPSRIHIHVQ